MSIGERIKEERKKKGFNQAQLAELIGVHEMTLRRWENDIRSPNSKSLYALADALNTSANYLMGETDDPAPMVGRVQNVDSNFIEKNEDTSIQQKDIDNSTRSIVYESSPVPENSIVYEFGHGKRLVFPMGTPESIIIATIAAVDKRG
ncbi:hypothetical protein AGMMS50276_28470 [Synergistales bacterium]|nr:hypothetical protein AGMMS50276_28470 [Synergistales bacterium]